MIEYAAATTIPPRADACFKVIVLFPFAAVSVILGDFLAILIFANHNELRPSSMAIDARVRPLAYVRRRRLLSKNGFALHLSQTCRTTALILPFSQS